MQGGLPGRWTGKDLGSARRQSPCVVLLIEDRYHPRIDCDCHAPGLTRAKFDTLPSYKPLERFTGARWKIRVHLWDLTASSIVRVFHRKTYGPLCMFGLQIGIGVGRI